MANTEDFRSFGLALDRAYELFRTCHNPDVVRWFESGNWNVSIQSDVGGNDRAGLVNGFNGRVGADGQQVNLVLRLDWDPTYMSHINVRTVNRQGYRVSYHLKFAAPIEFGWSQGPEYVKDQMDRLTHFIGEGVSIREAFDRIQYQPSGWLGRSS